MKPHNQITLLIDLDETIFDTLPLWCPFLSIALGVEVSINEVSQAGGLDNYFRDKPLYKEYLGLIDHMRADEHLYRNLPLIPGAVEAISQLALIPHVEINYLTARPRVIHKVSIEELKKQNFPDRPVITRPPSVPSNESVNWKWAIIKELRENIRQTIIIIDDNPSLTQRIRTYNKMSKSFIVGILFPGPISRYQIAFSNLRTDISTHSYVTYWDAIPKICLNYALGGIMPPL